MLRFALVLTALLSGCGENPFFLQAHAIAVCQHLPGQRFQVPLAVREQYARLTPTVQHGVRLERTFDFDVRAEVPPGLEVTPELHFALTSARLTTVGAEDDLGFVDEAQLLLSPPLSSGLAPRSFEYAPTDPVPRTVAWNGEAFDVAAYLETGTLSYSVSLVGSLPPGDVVVDLEVCAEVAVKLEYL